MRYLLPLTVDVPSAYSRAGILNRSARPDKETDYEAIKFKANHKKIWYP